MKTQSTVTKQGKLTEITAKKFESAIHQYAQGEKREQEIRLTIETEITELLEKYKDELDCLAQSKQTAFETAKNYCQTNKEALFSKRRSIATTAGLAGFRLGTPRLKTNKGTDWNSIVALLKAKLPAYIRTTEEPAKDLLLADRHKENVAPVLIDIGLTIVQDELFYIEIKKAA